MRISILERYLTKTRSAQTLCEEAARERFEQSDAFSLTLADNLFVSRSLTVKLKQKKGVFL